MGTNAPIQFDINGRPILPQKAVIPPVAPPITSPMAVPIVETPKAPIGPSLGMSFLDVGKTRTNCVELLPRDGAENSVFGSGNKFVNPLDILEKAKNKDALSKDIQGFGTVLTAEGSAAALREKLSTAKNDKEQSAMISRYTDAIRDEYSATAVGGSISALNDSIVVGASKKIVNVNAPEPVKTAAGVAVAEQIPNVSEDKRLEVLQVVLATDNTKVQEHAAPKVVSLPEKHQEKGAQAVVDTGKPSVIGALTAFGHKLKTSGQRVIIKGGLATGIEFIEQHFAKHEGEYDKSLQGDLFDRLIQSKHKGVRVTSARNFHTLDETVQVPASEKIAATREKDVVDAAATVAHFTAEKNQVTVATNLFNTKIESAQLIIAQNEGKYAVNNQTEIVKLGVSSEYQNVVNATAENLHTLDKSKQVDAVNILASTKNDKVNMEEANKIAANKYGEYDESCKNDIKEAFSKSEYKRVREIASEQYKADIKRVQEQRGAIKAANTTASAQSNNTVEVSESQVSSVKEAIESNEPAKIDEAISKLTSGQIANIASTLTSAELCRIIDKINPLDLPLDKLKGVINQLPDGAQKTELVNVYRKRVPNDLLNDVATFNSGAQVALLKGADSTILAKINRNDLSTLAKIEYDKNEATKSPSKRLLLTGSSIA